MMAIVVVIIMMIAAMVAAMIAAIMVTIMVVVMKGMTIIAKGMAKNDRPLILVIG